MYLMTAIPSGRSRTRNRGAAAARTISAPLYMHEVLLHAFEIELAEDAQRNPRAARHRHPVPFRVVEHQAMAGELADLLSRLVPDQHADVAGRRDERDAERAVEVVAARSVRHRIAMRRHERVLAHERTHEADVPKRQRFDGRDRVPNALGELRSPEPAPVRQILVHREARIAPNVVDRRIAQIENLRAAQLAAFYAVIPVRIDAYIVFARRRPDWNFAGQALRHLPLVRRGIDEEVRRAKNLVRHACMVEAVIERRSENIAGRD